MVTHRNRAILFGGTTDQKGRGDKVYSELHNELFQFSFDRQRWYPVLLKGPSKQQQQSASSEGSAGMWLNVDTHATRLTTPSCIPSPHHTNCIHVMLHRVATPLQIKHCGFNK